MASRNIHALFQANFLHKAHGYCVTTFLIYFFGVLTSATAFAQELTGQALFDRIKQGQVVVLMRHAQTQPGTGDPPGFKLSDCSTQRNLSVEGKAQSERFGAMLRDAGIAPTAVRSSAWCRCKDTAKLAFSDYRVWSQLNSFFDARSAEPAQTGELVRALQALKPGQTEVWITHQVNITALTGLVPAMGEAFVVRAGNRGVEVIGRLQP